jgi:type IV secretory pathway component VirB8
MTEKEKNSAELKRALFFAGGILFGILMFVGTMKIIEVVPLLIHFDRYERRMMVIDSVDAEYGKSGRALSYVGYGHVGASQRLRVSLGSVDNKKISAFVEKVVNNDTASIEVFYYRQGNSAFRSKHFSFSEFRSEAITNLKRAILYMSPSLICFFFALFYHVKLMKESSRNQKRKLSRM